MISYFTGKEILCREGYAYHFSLQSLPPLSSSLPCFLLSARMPFDLERTTPFGVSAKEVIDLLQDPKRFMIASGGTEEESIHYDESAGIWHGEFCLLYIFGEIKMSIPC